VLLTTETSRFRVVLLQSLYDWVVAEEPDLLD